MTPFAWDVSAPGSGTAHDTILALLRESCERWPRAPIMIFEDSVVVDRAGFKDRIERFAAYLRARIDPGDRVAFMSPNRAEFMIAWFAVVAARGILVAINPTSREHEAAQLLTDSGARLLITAPELVPLIEGVRSSCPALADILVLEDKEPDGLAAYGSDERLALSTVSPSPDAVTNIYYTSGSTGMPKGCMLNHVHWLRWVDLIIRVYKPTIEDRFLCCLQFYYSDSAWLLLTSLQTGSALVIMRRFSVRRFWPLVREQGVTLLFSMASIPVLLLKAPPSPDDRRHKVRLAIHAGIPPELHQDMAERWGFPWVETYGSTETGVNVGMPPELGAAMTGSGSMGLVYPEATVEVVDADGNPVAPGQEGEIRIRTPGLMSGYWNRPDALRQVLRDGWFYLGDIVRTDSRGFFYFVGRTKDIIRRSGQNISSVEVESALVANPKIKEAAVIPVPDSLRGEEVKAYVILAEGETAETCPPGAIIAHCDRRLTRYKVPRYLEYRTESFPLTPSMKIAKARLLAERTDHIAGSWDREKDLGW